MYFNAKFSVSYKTHAVNKAVGGRFFLRIRYAIRAQNSKLKQTKNIIRCTDVYFSRASFSFAFF